MNRYLGERLSGDEYSFHLGNGTHGQYIEF